MYKRRGLKPKETKIQKLFLLDGTPVNNLLDIPKEAVVLIASDQKEYIGVEFENTQLTELNK